MKPAHRIASLTGELCARRLALARERQIALDPNRPKANDCNGKIKLDLKKTFGDNEERHKHELIRHMDNVTIFQCHAIKGELECHTTDQKKKTVDKAWERLKAIKISAALQNEQFKSLMPKTVRKTYKNLDLCFIREAFKIAEDALTGKDNPLRTPDDHIIKGFPQLGDLEPTGQWWPRNPAELKTIDPKEYLNAKIVLRKKPPGWMTKENMIRLYEKAEQARAKGLFIKIDKEDLECNPVYAFGVEQGAFIVQADGSKYYLKIRMCLDFRRFNASWQATEFMRLLSNKNITTMTDILFNGDIATDPTQKKFENCPGRNEPRDMHADLKPEWRKRILNAHASGKITRKVGFLKTDFSGYYHQFPVRDPKLNVAATWNPFKMEYEYDQGLGMLFGHASSPYEACRISEQLMGIINYFFEYPAAIYIDDTVALTTLDDCAERTENIRKLFEMAGLVLAEEKLETTDKDGTLEVLGMEYASLNDGVLFYPPEKKLDKVSECAAVVKYQAHPKKYNDPPEYILELPDKRELNQKDIQRFCGVVIFSTYLSGNSRFGALLRPIHGWCADGVVEKLRFHEAERKMLARQVNTVEEQVLKNPPLKIWRSPRRPQIWISSDAAMPEKDERGLIPAMIGALFGSVEQGYSYVAEEVDTTSLQFMTKVHIGVLELMAAATALQVFHKPLQGFRVCFQIDNSGAGCALVKGYSSCLAQQAIVEITNEIMARFGLEVYWVFVKSAENNSDYTTRPELLRHFLNTFPGSSKKEANTRKLISDINRKYGEIIRYLGPWTAYTLILRKQKKTPTQNGPDERFKFEPIALNLVPSLWPDLWTCKRFREKWRSEIGLLERQGPVRTVRSQRPASFKESVKTRAKVTKEDKKTTRQMGRHGRH